ncbi:MAG: DUF3644 domain-containing protein [Elusimicrobiota bacterium]|jgi:hypothetical protein
MRPPLHSKFVDKAQAAITSAIEVYNKPAFGYREETFALLALNAWELLLKGKVLKDSKNNLGAIRVFEHRHTKSGGKTKKRYLKRNRTGNPMTIGIGSCIDALNRTKAQVSNEVIANIYALVAIRDNSAHYITASPVLARQVLEIASASVKNFVTLAKHWFGQDFSNTLTMMLPLSFISGDKEVESVVVTADEGRLIGYLQHLSEKDSNPEAPFSVAVRLQVKFEKSSQATVPKVQWSNDPDAVKVTISEEDVRAKFPWDYRELVRRLKARYSDFKQDERFHSIRKPLLADAKLTKSRFLDPANPKSPKKDFYNPNVIPTFDRHYTQDPHAAIRELL